MCSGKTPQFVIVGGGQAGGWAAKTLRDSGFGGRIVLVGDELYPPYERPPLSKAVLAAEKAPESCYLWPEHKLRDLDIDFEKGATAVAVDRSLREVSLSDDRRISYERLLLATGARPRQLILPGATLPGIHYLRTIQDSVDIRRSLATVERLLVVGGGWIGLEVAATAVSKGIAVTLVEASDRLCGRSLPQTLASYFFDLHTRWGVDVWLNAKLVSFEGEGRVEAAVFEDGRTLDVQAAVIGIGVEPNAELGADCGLRVDNGIVVDDSTCTSDRDIFAAGDVTNQPYGGVGGRIRLESWKNAQDQGIAAAKAMLGEAPPKRNLPWFWSDQYHITFQMLGIPEATDGVYQKGDPSSGPFVQYFIQGDRLSAVAAVSSPRDLREARRAMIDQRPFDTAGLTPVVYADSTRVPGLAFRKGTVWCD